MKDEQIKEELQELNQALAVVNRWMDTEDGKKLAQSITNEFLNVKTSHYRTELADLFFKEVNE